MTFAECDAMDASIGYFMTEVRVGDWRRSVAWYRDVLGLRIVLEDAAGRFALLEAAGGGRVAIKEGAPGRDARGAVRLVFEVADVDGWRRDLDARGVATSGPTARPEGYRELALDDPDGTPIGLFAWARRINEGPR